MFFPDAWDDFVLARLGSLSMSTKMGVFRLGPESSHNDHPGVTTATTGTDDLHILYSTD